LRRAWAFLALCSAGGLAWLGCEEQASHVYLAQLYDPDADCLYPSASIDFVLGPAGGPGAPCDAECISDFDGQVLLSATCPPWPVEFNAASSAPSCANALAARCRQCPLDGGGVRVVCDAGRE
jgi:hypothetical protein